MSLVQYQDGLLTSSKCKFQKTGLLIDEAISELEYKQLGVFLKQVEGSVQFWVGDWIRFGERKWGQKYDQAEEITGLDYGTLRNLTSVSNAVDLSRRHDNLSFTHHQEVASLKPEDQDFLLNKAEKVFRQWLV